MFGTIDTWLIWNLTGGAAHVTDCSNASRTMLMDLATGAWDDELLGIFEIPRAVLPAIVPSSFRVGVIETKPFAGIPISGIAGDQQAALAGQACFRAGLSKNTYGTGCFALTHTGNLQPHSTQRLLATRAAAFWRPARVRARRKRVYRRRRDSSAAARPNGFHSNSRRSPKPSLPRFRTRGASHVVPAFVGLGGASLELRRARHDPRPDARQ